MWLKTSFNDPPTAVGGNRPVLFNLILGHMLPALRLSRWRVVDFNVRDGRAGFGRFDREFQLDGLDCRKAQDALVADGCLPRDGLPASSAPDFQRKLHHALPERDVLLRHESVDLNLA